MAKKLPNQNTQSLAFASLLGATAIWAVAGPVIKLTLYHLPVVSFLFLRLLIVCVIMLPFIAMELQRTKVDKIC